MLAIKWKNFSRSGLTKAVVYFLLVLMIMIFGYKGIKLLSIEINSEQYVNTEYLESEEFQSKFVDFVHELFSAYKGKTSQKIIDGSLEDTLKNNGVFQYRMKVNNIEISNVESGLEQFKKLPFFVYYDKEKWLNYASDEFQNLDWFNMSQITQAYTEKNLMQLLNKEGDFIAIGMNPLYYKNAQEQYEIQVLEQKQKLEKQKQTVDREIQTEFILVIAGILCFVYLVCVAGRRPNTEKIHLLTFDTIFLELQLGLCLGYFLLTVMFILRSMFGQYIGMLLKEDAQIYFVLLLCTSWVILFGELILSQVRKIKAHQFLHYSLCFRLARTILEGGNLMFLVVSAAILLPLLCYFRILVPFVILGCIVWGVIKVEEFNKIFETAKKIKAGELNNPIVLKGNGKFAILADNINTISSGFDQAVGNAVKSERLKTELISNVSHDIKTPLTSIITYVDLLKQEEIESDKVKEYIAVLERKSLRLKVLTTDLFEAAKATSGAIPVTLGKVELGAFMQQGLAEFEDKMKEANLEVKINLPKENILIKADGRLIWRVFENLMSNIVKYALTGSRVYINIQEEKNTVTFIIKNVSAYELNISTEELLERFTRGDESRNSEGSGLGLNIARSLVELQHGKFDIEIDGDLFKAKVTMPKWQEDKEETGEE